MFDGLLLQLEAYLEDIQRAREQPSQSTRHCSGHQSVIHPLLASIYWRKHQTVQYTCELRENPCPAPVTPTHCPACAASPVLCL